MEFYHRNHLKLLECIGFYSYLLVYRPKLVSINLHPYQHTTLQEQIIYIKIGIHCQCNKVNKLKKKKELQVKLIGCLS